MASVDFIIQKFVKMHGHINVRYQYPLTRNKQRCSHFLTIRRGSGLTGVIYFLVRSMENSGRSAIDPSTRLLLRYI